MASAQASFAFIKIIVKDLDRTTWFYEEVLSFKLTRTIELPGIVERILTSATEESGPSIILYHHTDQREITIGNGWGPMGLRVDDVDAIHQSAVDNGGQSSQIPAFFGTTRIAHILDPEGHDIELVGRR